MITYSFYTFNLNVHDLSHVLIIIFQYIVSDHRYTQHDLLRQPVSQTLQMPPPPQEPPLNPERAILIQRVPHRQRKSGKGRH